MVQILKYTFISTIIIISSITFAINEEFTVPIYLTVPEYLKITDLSQSSLLLYADISNWIYSVIAEDSLTFNVESNVNYDLTAVFTPSVSWLGTYNLLLSGTGGTPGIQDYTLTFQLEVDVWEGIIYTFMEGQIGDIQITVSST
jgi:hypothetical protein